MITFRLHPLKSKINDFTNQLNNANTCGRSDWRLPDLFELSRLTQLGVQIRARMFPYINIGPHISSTGGQYSEFKKGVNLENGKVSDYRENRPYYSMLVAGDIDKELLHRVSIINDSKQCTPIMVNKNECTLQNCIDDGLCHQPQPKCTAKKVQNKECTFQKCLMDNECENSPHKCMPSDVGSKCKYIECIKYHGCLIE